MNNRLYKGKRIDTGEWVYGELIDDIYIKPVDTYIEGTGNKDNGLVFIEVAVYEVDEKTVEQCAGVKVGETICDTEVYEGDIFVLVERNEKENTSWVIYYDKDLFEWRADCIADITTWSLFKLVSYPLRKIGNIYDNPELLEVVDG